MYSINTKAMWMLGIGLVQDTSFLRPMLVSFDKAHSSHTTLKVHPEHYEVFAEKPRLLQE